MESVNANTTAPPKPPRPRVRKRFWIPAVLFVALVVGGAAMYWWARWLAAPPPPPQERQLPTYANSLGMEFLLIPAGELWMGCTSTRTQDHKERSLGNPPHGVTLSRPFYLGKHEVTQAQWEAVMGTNPSKFKGADRPVDNVSWEDAQAFIQKLNAKEGHNRYRLPTEAEWEYAARAGWVGDISLYYGAATDYTFGNDVAMLTDYAWYDANAGGETHPVGQKRPNPWGLYDMHGNVGEWVQDWMGDYEDKEVVDPQGPQQDGSNSWDQRVFRGGSWAYGARDCRSYARNSYRPDYRNDFIGFRLALTPEQ